MFDNVIITDDWSYHFHKEMSSYAQNRPYR